MFDVDRAARLLKEARIRSNLTQSALADKLGVTYQAVSNWERGHSLPDISNLARLCEILDLDLYALVGATQNQALVDAILSGDGNLRGASAEELASVAALIPPEQLMDALREIKTPVRDMETLIELAPFVDGEFLETLGSDVVPSYIGEVVALSPFVSDALCARWIGELERREDFSLDVGLLSALGPYLSRETMDRLSERVIPDSLVILDSVAPFLSQEALCRLAGRLETITPDDYLIGVSCLTPFLGQNAMRALHKKVVE